MMEYTDNFDERRTEAISLLEDDSVVSYHVAVVQEGGEIEERAFRAGHSIEDEQRSAEINDELIGKMLKTYAEYTDTDIEAVAQAGIDRADEMG
jgi:hypothetical protein